MSLIRTHPDNPNMEKTKMASELPLPPAYPNAPPPYSQGKVSYKLIKSFSTMDPEDLTHTQLFYNTTNVYAPRESVKPSYSREMFLHDAHRKQYWFTSALDHCKPISCEASPTVWQLRQPAHVTMGACPTKISKNPTFELTHMLTGSQASFTRNIEKEGYLGDAMLPEDGGGSIQSFNWKRSGEGRWVLVFPKEPEYALVELRPTANDNEIDFVFVANPPLGWGGVDGRSVVWEEFVLASSVVVQKEVVKEKRKQPGFFRRLFRNCFA